ncbi:MAG: type II secretion system protein N [Burkholderiaceae bacterium]
MAFTWFVRLLTLAVWAVAAGSATLWGMKHLQTGSDQTSAATVAPAVAQAAPADVQRVLGRSVVAFAPAAAAPPKPADPSTRFTLLGVVASRGSAGVALLSIDGKVARPYRVGSEVEDGLKLIKVAVRAVTLESSKGGPSFTLELPRSGQPVVNARSMPSAAASAARPSS